MKKITFNVIWLFLLAIPFEIAAIIVFSSKANNVIGSVLLCIGMLLYLVGIFLSRKERKAEEAAKNNVEEKVAATAQTQTTETEMVETETKA